ncbi:MAG: hypothetical protein K8I30_15830 [Anaerolineae bacterium]|nr:hypothetical protein [Anaerolineae bacterium]
MKNSPVFSILALMSLMMVACSSGNSATTQEATIVPVVNEATGYSLDWKLAPDEKLAYKTAMNQATGSSPNLSIDLDKLFSDTPNFDELSQQLSRLTLPETGSMISILEPNARGNITVEMILDEIKTPENPQDDELSQSLTQAMQAMEGTVQLRGELTPDGSVASFYLEERQRNLLAMLFELPTGMVHVGDSWQLAFNCIQMGSGFIANTASKVNRVAFTGLTQTADGKPVAILDYMLVESVDGTFQSPMSDEASPSSMTCSFLGRGQFLIEQGRWQQLIGEFAISSTGIMETDIVQQFALTPLEAIPEAYR